MPTSLWASDSHSRTLRLRCQVKSCVSSLRWSLVEPFALRLHYDLKSGFVCPRGHETRSPVRELLDWLSTEAAAVSAGGRRGEGAGGRHGTTRQ
jgi:hypothetical protein